MSELYYVLSLKWSRSSDHLIWWRANNAGYTYVLDAAGTYTAEQIAGAPSYYNDGENTLAVPCSVAEKHAYRVVSAGGSKVDEMRAAAPAPVARCYASPREGAVSS